MRRSSTGRPASARGYRSALRRLAVIAAIGITLFETIGPLAPSASAVGNGQNEDQAVDLATGGPVHPIPYMFPDDGGSEGAAGADTSIGLRPDFESPGRPESKTAAQELWTSDRRVWANPDGTYTTEYGPRLNYKDESGVWAPIDLTLVQREDGYAPAATGTDLVLAPAADPGVLASLTGDAGTIALRTTDLASGVNDGEKLTFNAPSIASATSFVRPTDTGFEFGATFDEPGTPPTITFTLETGDLTAILEKNGLAIVLEGLDKAGEPVEVGRISAPSVLDAIEHEADASYLTVTLQLVSDGVYDITYGISEKWYLAEDRVFPITLDPTACLRSGDTGCSVNTNIFDIWYGNGQPSQAADSSVTHYIRVGYYQGDGNPWGQTRGALYFPGATLPDGAMVTNATLDLREANNLSGGTTAKIFARLIDKSTGWTLDTASASWNSLASAYDGTYDSAQYSPCDTGATDCTLSMDVTKIVRAWYTRRGPDWQPNAGIQLRYAVEDTAHAYDETSFYRSTESLSDRPKLTITYEVPAFELDFDPALGPTYAPSTMIAGQGTLLPITITNNSAYTWNTTDYRIAYRWYDTKGGVVGSTGLITLGSSVSAGASYTPSPAPSLTPPGLGQFTLRFDVVKIVGGVNLFASDWALPTLYYSRNKKILTSDSTRWTGSSAIERAEFGITVVSGQGNRGTIRSVTTGDGGQLGINLWSKSLTYGGDTGLGIGDRMPVGLSYGYNSKDAGACGSQPYFGVLDACGWFTNYDERVTAGSSSGDFTYYDPHGSSYYIDSDNGGQLIGAPVQLSRIRATLFNENRPTSGGTLVSAASEGIPATSGPNVVRVPANADAILAGFTPNGAELSLNTYRQFSFALRNTDAASTAICLEIHNRTKETYKWICLTAGPTFGPGGDANYFWPGDVVLDQWSNHQNDIWDSVKANSVFGSPTDDYYIKTVKIKSSSPSNAGYTYVDNVAVTQRRIWSVPAGSQPSWTSGTVINNTTEFVDQNSSQIATSASCTGTCYSSLADNGAPLDSLQAAPFARWWWKKAGGTSVSMQFNFTDIRTSATGTITYYAGALPTGASASTSVQISPTLPGHFTRVTRNILQDARQILNFYNDAPTGTSSASPPTQGPSPDAVQWTGFTASAVDGQYLLLENLELFSGPEWAQAGTLNRYADEDPGNSVYDFQAEFPDGSTHFFNRDGLLTGIKDRYENRIDLDWTYGASGSGQAAYTLTAIHAPGDSTVSGGNTYDRQIDVTRSTVTGFNQVTFTERLGTTGTPITGRRADFYVATGTGTTWGADDLVKISPARHTSATCGTQPNGCTEFRYTSTTSHLLKVAGDPRWDGGSGGASLEITWSGGNPTEVLDKSHGNAALLRVNTFDRGRTNSPSYVRPLYQDAAAAAAGFAIHLDLTPEGSVQTEYVRQGPCTANDCTTSPPSDTSGTLGVRKAVTYAFDGLAKVSSVTTYRCPGVTLDGCTGTTALLTVTRQGSRASAKVDNYPDALAAAEVAWTQSADQYFASMRDSGGGNPDLYRTEYQYNGVHSPIVVTNPVTNRVVDYPGTTKGVGSLGAYWRVGEGSGTLVDSSGNGYSGTGTSVSYSQAGALIRDSNAALGFNGTSSKVTSTRAMPSSAYTLSGWVKFTTIGAGDVGLFGRYTVNSGVLIYQRSGDKTIALAHNAGRVFTSFSPDIGRWYFVAATWDGAIANLYVDGERIGSEAITGAPAAGATTFEIGTWGNAGAGHFLDGSIDEVAVHTAALDQPAIRASFQSGRGIATVRVETTYGWTYPASTKHLDAHPTQTATQLVTNGDFAAGLSGWSASSTATYDGSVIKLPTFATASQVAQVVPGQRVHFQVAGRTDGTSGSTARLRLAYWQISTGTWVDLVDDSIANTTTWTTRAFQYTVPSSDTTGLMRVSLSDGAAIGQAWFDNVLLVTAWQAVTFRPHTNVAAGGTPAKYLQDGLPETTTTFGASLTARVDKLVYTATTAHPALFATSTIANYLDGTQGPAPEEDATTVATYDTWGRRLSLTDPDGVMNTNVYDATNLTDLTQTLDDFGAATVMTYDAVGNGLTTTTPLGRVTSATYDTRNHVLTATAPDGVVSRTDYDNYGRATASWSNHVNGVVEAGDNDLTDDLLTTFTYDAWGRVTQQDVDCGSVATCATGGLDARTTTTYDLLGNAVATTAYSGSGGAGGTGRTTTNHFETYGTNPTYTRSSASGVQLPIAPSSAPAPLCPGSASTRCNVAAVWTLNGANASAVDMQGRAFATTDAYGITTLADADIAGRTITSISNYVAGGASTSDQNVTSRTEYNIAGDVIVAWDAAGRRDVRTYDPLGRLLEVSHRDQSGTEFTKESTQYLPSGRVDQTFDGSAWTRTVYDDAGRAIRTIANYDSTGAGMTLDALEGTGSSWSIASSGFFTSSAATARTDDTDSAGNAYTMVAPQSGRGRLHVTTHATNTNDGAWLDLSGPSFQSGHTYKASFDLATDTASVSLTAYLGQDQSGGTYGSLGITSTTAWTRYTVSWTAGSSISSNVHFAVRKPAAGTTQLYLDNLVVWDTNAGWIDRNIVSSVTSYDADGEIIASALAPGDPTTERPLVTTVGFDPAGRGVITTVNGASGVNAATILGTTNLAAYVALDERLGSPYADRKPGAGAFTVSGTAPTNGVAGGIDEARTALRFSGAGYLTRAANATSNTTNVSMEAWIRSDTTPAGTVVVAANGDSSDSWGIAVDASGNAAGFTQKSSNPGAGFTTMSTTTTKVTDGAWHHLVLTRGASTWAMTVDGVAKTLSSNTTNPGMPAARFTIGAWSDGTRGFVGEIDEVSAYAADISGSTAAAHWAAGRVADTVTALTSRTAFDRLGRATDIWAPDLVRTKATYDRLGNQIETIANYRDGTTTGGTADDDIRSTYAYDVLGELIGYCPAEEVKVGGCDPSNSAEDQAWRYAFDALGRQTTTIPPDNTAVTDLTTELVVYEAGGRVAQTCRYVAGAACASTNSRHVDFTYDNLGRVLTQKTYDRGAGSDTLKFTKTLTWNADGSPNTVNEGSDTLTYVYDTAGRLSQFKRSSTVLTSYTYTAGTSTIASRTDGTQGMVNFTYDWARRQTVIDPPDTYTAGTVTRSYRLDGLLSTQSFPSSISETLAYDAAKRPTSISLGTAGSLSQTYDRAGSVTSDGRSLTGITGDAGSNTQSFAYDALHRLTGSSGLAAGSTSYQYDLDGNRTRRVEAGVTTDYLYDRADQLQQQTIGVTTRTFAYDRYGNLTQSADAASAYTTYAYDEASRLTGITPPTGGAVSFTLDALDRPKDRSVAGSGTSDTYGYVDASETAWLTGQATTTGALVDAEGTRLALKTGSSVSWLVFDLHGSVAGLCPAGTTSLADAYRYDGWGRQVAKSGISTNPYRYRGLLNLGADELSGALLAMGAREYSSQLGTFTQEDSVAGGAANPATMNRFLYALANPATLVDPDGHRACLDTGDACTTSGAIDLFSTTRQADASIVSRPRVVTPHGAATEDWGTWTGYNPWDLAQDPTLLALKNQLYQQGCTVPWETGCQALNEIAAWESENKTLYCSFHKAECDKGFVREVHDTLSGLGMAPFLGFIFDGADMLLYIAEGDGGGSLLAMGSMVPIVGDAGRATKKLVDEGVDMASARFAQRSFSEAFSKKGDFSGLTIDDVAGALRAGSKSLDDVPVIVIVRDGNTLIMNTRSAQALTRAGIPRSIWNVLNKTGDDFFETELTKRLARNDLDSSGYIFP